MANQAENGVSEPEGQEDKRFEQAYQLYYEAFKHLTTLNTGSILILVALTERFFASPIWKALIVTALISFVLSILSSVLMMFLITDSVRGKDYSSSRAQSVSILTSLIAFVLGIVSVVIFAVRNLFR